MSIRGLLEGGVSALVASPAVRSARRRVARAGRRLAGAPPTIHYFHGAADPWSALLVGLLPRLEAAHGVRVVPHLVPAPGPSVAPEPALLMAWALRDCAQLARAHALPFPADAQPPGAEAVARAEALLAGALAGGIAPFAACAAGVNAALWGGAAWPAGGVDPAAALAGGSRALARAGHFSPALLAFEGECHWGLDRLPRLHAQLAEAGHPGAPLLRQLEAGAGPGSVPGGDSGGVALHFFLSLRSPYTHLAAARVRRLAERWRARLVLRPLLPMVMRGLPVPRAKRIAIVRDSADEAQRLGIPFGRICDPVGAGVERGLAVLHRAIALGAGPAFAESFLGGAFAEAVDASTNAGLWRMAERAGLTRADVAAALADQSWRPVAEANRAELSRLGLWGVPAFRVGARPAQWGQDRLWAVERDLMAEADAVAAAA